MQPLDSARLLQSPDLLLPADIKVKSRSECKLTGWQKSILGKLVTFIFQL
jgi:hypothetical protein